MHYQLPEADALQHFKENGFLHLPGFFPATSATGTDFLTLAAALLSVEKLILQKTVWQVDGPDAPAGKLQTVGEGLLCIAVLQCKIPAAFTVAVGINKALPVLDVTAAESEFTDWTIMRYDTTSVQLHEVLLQAGDVLALASSAYYRKLQNTEKQTRHFCEFRFQTA